MPDPTLIAKLKAARDELTTTTIYAYNRGVEDMHDAALAALTPDAAKMSEQDTRDFIAQECGGDTDIIPHYLEPTTPDAGEGEDNHKERMAEFGQFMFDAVEALCNEDCRHYMPLKDTPLEKVTDGYIDAWRRLKRENESLQSEVARLSAPREEVDWPTEEGWWWFKTKHQSTLNYVIESAGELIIVDDDGDETRANFEQRHGRGRFIRCEPNPFTEQP